MKLKSFVDFVICDITTAVSTCCYRYLLLLVFRSLMTSCRDCLLDFWHL